MTFKIILFFLSFFSFLNTQAKNNPVKDSLSVVSSTKEALFEKNIKTLYQLLEPEKFSLDYDAFRYAYIGYQNLKNQQRLNDKALLSIIDFTQNSNQKRFYTIDLEQKRIIYNTYVSHGRKSGDSVTTSFSDILNSNQSSIGFYITGNTYNGSNGFSLQLHGDEVGYNSNIAKRGVVIHTADYVSESYIKKYGRLGRSQGCPVLPEDIYKEIIEVIKNKTLVFAYYNNKKYLSSSKYLKTKSLLF